MNKNDLNSSNENNNTQKINRQEAMWQSFLLVPTEKAGSYLSFLEFTGHYKFSPIHIPSIWAIVIPRNHKISQEDVCHLQRVYFTCNEDGACTITRTEKADFYKSSSNYTLYDPKYPNAEFRIMNDVKIQAGSRLNIRGISWRRLVPLNKDILNDLCQHEHFFYTALNQ